MLFPHELRRGKVLYPCAANVKRPASAHPEVSADPRTQIALHHSRIYEFASSPTQRTVGSSSPGSLEDRLEANGVLFQDREPESFRRRNPKSHRETLQN